MKIISASTWPPPGFKQPETNLPGGYNIPQPPPEPRITLVFDNGGRTTTKISQMLAYQQQKP